MSTFFDPFSRFSNLDSKLLVSCNKGLDFAGGLYVVDFGLKNMSKLLEADCRGIARTGDSFYIATNSHGILKLDRNFNIVDQYDVKDLDLHGMQFGPDNLLYVVETGRNAIGIYVTEPFARVDEIKISEYASDYNHINDLWIEGNRLYLSMFGLDSNWKECVGDYDGVVAEYDLRSKELVHVHLRNLQFPHSVQFIRNKLHVCNSLGLSLNVDDNTVAKLGGFTRGLAFDGWNYYVGQSEMRHTNRMTSRAPSYSMDCGIHIIESSSGATRFLHMPTTQVYEICVLSDAKYADSFEPDSENAFKSITSTNEWHDMENTHIWMAASKASLMLHQSRGFNKLLVIVVNACPREIECEVFVNQEVIGVVHFRSTGVQEAEFALDPNDGPIEISFSVPFLWSPAEELSNGDTRQLGIGVKTIRVLE